MRLEPILSPDLTLLLPAAPSRDAVLSTLAHLAHLRFPEITEPAFLDGFIDRESKFPTGTPEGVAFPHALMPEVPDSALIIMLLKPGVKWSEQNHPPQDLIFAILGNSDTPWEHVRLLARLSRICRGTGALAKFRAAPDAAALHEALLEEDRKHG